MTWNARPGCGGGGVQGLLVFWSLVPNIWVNDRKHLSTWEVASSAANAKKISTQRMHFARKHGCVWVVTPLKSQVLRLRRHGPPRLWSRQR